MTVEYTLLALAVPALLAAAGFAVWTRLRTRRMLDTLGKMLDDAIRGEFRESLYDESRLSALETRMAHYLSASAVSAKNLAEEKDAIKTLIGDISHQTKTPIANLLLYAQLLEEQDLPPESREYASALEHQAEKLRFLIDALVKTSRLESGRPCHDAQASWHPTAVGCRLGPGRSRSGGQSDHPDGRAHGPDRPVRPQVDSGGPV